MIKDRLKNMENFNINMANQVLQTLNSLNHNIVILNGMLKTRGNFVEEGKDTKKDRMEVDTTTDNSQNLKHQSCTKDKDFSTEDLQRIKDAAETIQDLKRRAVEQAKEM